MSGRRRPLLDASAEHQRILDGLGEAGRPWVLEELRFAWREAQAEAAVAYCHWRRMRDRASYAVYRAAQDRADAAQEAFSEPWVGGSASDAGAS
jgi:hypothetical protein